MVENIWPRSLWKNTGKRCVLTAGVNATEVKMTKKTIALKDAETKALQSYGLCLSYDMKRNTAR